VNRQTHDPGQNRSTALTSPGWPPAPDPRRARWRARKRRASLRASGRNRSISFHHGHGRSPWRAQRWKQILTKAAALCRQASINGPPTSAEPPFRRRPPFVPHSWSACGPSAPSCAKTCPKSVYQPASPQPRGAPRGRRAVAPQAAFFSIFSKRRRTGGPSSSRSSTPRLGSWLGIPVVDAAPGPGFAPARRRSSSRTRKRVEHPRVRC